MLYPERTSLSKASQFGSLTSTSKIIPSLGPDAVIEFGNQSLSLDSARGGIPYRLSMDRAKEDFNFSCMPLEEAVLIHINDARQEASLKPLAG